MKELFKISFGSCLGVFLALGMMTLIGMCSVGSLISGASKGGEAKPNTILKISLNSPVPEKTNNVAKSPYEFNTTSVTGLNDILTAVKRAKEDDNIKGIYLDLADPAVGMATLSRLRKSLVDFKESGKFIMSYGNYYTEKSYYLASVADSIYVNPMGGVVFDGFSGQVPFFKNMIDRLGIKMQVFHVGEFKSATEPFRYTEMTPENKTQVRAYLEGNYEIFLADIAKSRKTTPAKLREVADGYLLREAKDAVKYGFVDRLVYKDQVLDVLKTKLGLDADEDIKAISLSSYASGNEKSKGAKKNKIAVVYAEGSIVDGKGEAGSIGGEKYSRLIRKIRQDDKVKAIVMRVNSGGGSALASELIWRELEMAKKDGITVVTSMGDVAASGGYYIAANSDKIFAEPNTITGSIGVFGMIPSMQEFMDNKIGITFDTVKTTQYSVGISPFFDISEEEGKIIQASVEEVYETFLKRVYQGRAKIKDREAANKIARGRVWTGKKALQLGLVDEMGGLQDAIDFAVSKAGVEKYRIAEYPDVKEPMEQLIEELTGKGGDDKGASALFDAMAKQEFGPELYEQYRQIKNIKNMNRIQTRMPFMIEVK